MKKILALILIATLPGSPCWAVPQLLNFQGKIQDSDNPGDGQRDITFRIFNAATGGAALFTEAHTGQNGVDVKSGFFNVLIGDITQGGIPATVFDGADKYIELQVGNDVLPRQRVTSVGYAFHAANADYAATAGALAGPMTVVSVSSVVTTSVVTSSITVADELVIGAHSIHIVGVPAGAAGKTGLGNAITMTQGPGEAAPEIRTALTGASVGLATPSGNTPLIINAGASGELDLNTLGNGNVVVAAGGGNVGIGITGPAAPLDVSGTTLFRNSSSWNALASAPSVSATGQGTIYYDLTSNQFLVSQSGSAYAPLRTGGATGATGPVGATGTASLTGGVANYDAIWTSGSSIGPGLVSETGGNVGVGIASPTSLLHVSDTIDNNSAETISAQPDAAAGNAGLTIQSNSPDVPPKNWTTFNVTLGC